MLKAVWTLLKVAAFALIVLAVGHWLRWDGRTVSDHVKSGMAAAERELSGDTPAAKGLKSAEELLTTERQKLRDLIRELNSKPSK
ncbi:MAG: hypothetical protein IT285_08420 [Bdellovibrionales bacterium]|nr:hypothetical protein [Bdellovibrionales bacterium]